MEINRLLTGAAVTKEAPQLGATKPQQASVETAINVERGKQMTAEMQNQVDRMNVSLEFTAYGQQGRKFAIVVADKVTGEIIREIPSRELQELYAKMDELSGMLFNTQV